MTKEVKPLDTNFCFHKGNKKVFEAISKLLLSCPNMREITLYPKDYDLLFNALNDYGKKTCKEQMIYRGCVLRRGHDA
jgi:hypothetical protein